MRILFIAGRKGSGKTTLGFDLPNNVFVCDKLLKSRSKYQYQRVTPTTKYIVCEISFLDDKMKERIKEIRSSHGIIVEEKGKEPFVLENVTFVFTVQINEYYNDDINF